MKSSRGLRGVDRLVAGALLLGAAGFLIWIISALSHLGVDSGDSGPYPSFGPDPHWRYVGVMLAYGAIWLAVTVRMLRRSSGEGTNRSLVLCLFGGLVMAAAGLSVCSGLDCLNAWLDFSRPVPVPVQVQTHRYEKRHTKYGAPHRVSIARVTRLDRPGQAFDVPWDSCQVTKSEVAARSATVNVAPGALGIPWISLPVVCHPLAVSDKPLVDHFFLGKGAPTIVVTIASTEGEGRATALKGLAAFLDVAERVSPSVPTAIISAGSPTEQPASGRCARCTTVPFEKIDREIHFAFTGREPGTDDDRIFLADRQGRRVFDASLGDVDQVPAFAAQLRAVAGAR
jgi:hypothetical protein